MKIHLSHHPPWQREKFETQLHFDPGKGVTGWSHQDVPDVSGVESMKSIIIGGEAGCSNLLAKTANISIILSCC